MEMRARALAAGVMEKVQPLLKSFSLAVGGRNDKEALSKWREVEAVIGELKEMHDLSSAAVVVARANTIANQVQLELRPAAPLPTKVEEESVAISLSEATPDPSVTPVPPSEVKSFDEILTMPNLEGDDAPGSPLTRTVTSISLLQPRPMIDPSIPQVPLYVVDIDLFMETHMKKVPELAAKLNAISPHPK